MIEYVRAPDLLCSWQGPHLVLSQLGRARRVPINLGYLQVLEAFSGPLSMSAFEERMAQEVSAGELRVVLGIAKQLIEWGALHPRDQRVDEVFFDTFVGFAIHNAMLKDTPRLRAYAQAIEAQVRPGDVVVDAGTGTGVLAMLAAKAGAAKVYALDRARVEGIATRLFEENGVRDRVVFVGGDIDDFDLSDPVDVVVSETFGSMAYVEGGVSSLVRLGQRILKPGGKLIPRGVELWAAPLADPARHADVVGVWGEPIEGLDFSALGPTAFSYGLSHDPIDPLVVAAEAQCFSRHDLHEGGAPELEAQMTFVSDGPRVLDGVGFFFVLDMGAQLRLDTGFEAAPTHWHQTYVPMPAMRVEQGDRFLIKVRIVPAEQELRKVNVDLHCAAVGVEGIIGEHKARVFVR